MYLESEDGKRLLLTLAGGYIVIIVHYTIIRLFNMFENFYNKRYFLI